MCIYNMHMVHYPYIIMTLWNYISNLTDSTSRLAGRRLRLFEIDFYVIHWADVKHQCNDTLSRLETTRAGNVPLLNDPALFAIDMLNHTEQHMRSIDALKQNPNLLEAIVTASISTRSPLKELLGPRAPGTYCRAASLYISCHKFKVILTKENFSYKNPWPQNRYKS